MTVAGGAGTTVGAPRGLAWPELPDGPARALRAWRRLLGAHRSVTAARVALRTDVARLGGAGLVRARAYGLSRIAGELCTRSGIAVAISGPIPRGPVVLVANHLSYLDPLVLTSVVPAVPIAKREVARWPLVGPLGREHGVLFVDRGAAASGARALRAGRRALASDVSVLNFPEGTTTTGERVLPFRRGVFGLARIADVAVVPVALAFDDPSLAWTGEDLFLPHFLRTLARPETVVRVRFGCPMTPRRYGSADDLAREARAVVEHLLGA